VSTKARLLTIICILFLAFSSLGIVSFTASQAPATFWTLVESIQLDGRSAWSAEEGAFTPAQIIAGDCTAMSNSSCGQ
jgi:hypothetical protein